ncbi:alpha/beta fold hydrolase [Microlunatus flavus]|uniref:Pimeloyl-ACP methyl ester carboxylesterase n=1 Tax=Microlunatus flavus TaxID=1036181 RepID=A0A1H8Z888_9ACTN|nr:alpha/beta fold hydrolase [Microlunatus flavus]SEP60602.1 Pimeloyl-ACP methyl ester carboxylesterase [Microlunatus flavus]
MGRRRSDVTVERVWSDGLYARVSTAGADGSRAFVLVPGIGVTSNYFERLALRLNELGPVVALDLPGFGGVPHPRHPLSIDEYAALVGRVLDRLGLEDPVLVGHSMGTQIVAALASTRALSDVVLISPVTDPRQRRASTVLLRFVQSCLHEPPRVVALALYAYALCGLRWIFRILPAVLRFRVEDVLPHVSARTLVVSGEEDRLVPPSWAQEVARLLPRGRAWRIPGAAHSVMHRDAEEVARLCVAHVRGDLPADDEVRRVPEETVEANDGPPALRGALLAATGRLTEVVGILADDDATIARGKTEQARAEERAEGVADDR